MRFKNEKEEKNSKLGYQLWQSNMIECSSFKGNKASLIKLDTLKACNRRILLMLQSTMYMPSVTIERRKMMWRQQNGKVHIQKKKKKSFKFFTWNCFSQYYHNLILMSRTNLTRCIWRVFLLFSDIPIWYSMETLTFTNIVI